MSDTVIEFPVSGSAPWPGPPLQTTQGEAVALAGGARSHATEVGSPQGRYGQVVTKWQSSAVSAPIPIDSLYPAVGGAASEILKALALLADSVKLSGEAREEAQADPVSADQLLQRLQVILPQLFACRRIGDGFGMVVNAIEAAFANRRGRPLSRAEITAVWISLKELRHRPFISLENAVRMVTDMEESGLEVDPKPLSDLLDALDDA